MARILRPEGRALIYAWAQEQERNSVPSTYLKQQRSDKIDSKKSDSVETIKPGSADSKKSECVEVSVSETRESENLAEKKENGHSVEASESKTGSNTGNGFPLVLPVHKNRTNFEHSDLLVPWKTKETNAPKVENGESKTYLRYYHIFKEEELEDLIRKSTVLSLQLTIEKSYYDQGNWCVVLVKNV